MFYAALIAIAGIGSVVAARSEQVFPWGKRPTRADRMAMAGIIAFIVGFCYLMLGRNADTSAWAWAGATMMFVGFVVGIVGFTYVVSKDEMAKQPAVVAARQNPHRGPRAYAPPPRIYVPK